MHYYVDKTAFIRELLGRQFKANLMIRPRRFGKSLMMGMLEDFFDISRASKAHFEGLEISGETELWMNQWPVVSLSLKSVEGLNFEEAFRMFRVLISDLCKKYAFLGESEKTDLDDRRIFGKFKAQEADKENLKNSYYREMLDVLSYVSDLRQNPDAKPGNYWGNTSHNAIIRQFIDRKDLRDSEYINGEIERLIAGESISKVIRCGICFFRKQCMVRFEN